MEREADRVVTRLDVLHRALTDRPLDVELLAELRGQARVLVALTAALGKLAPPAPVVPLAENPFRRSGGAVKSSELGAGNGSLRTGPTLPEPALRPGDGDAAAPREGAPDAAALSDGRAVPVLA